METETTLGFAGMCRNVRLWWINDAHSDPRYMNLFFYLSKDFACQGERITT